MLSSSIQVLVLKYSAFLFIQRNSSQIIIKGTVSVISNDLPFKCQCPIYKGTLESFVIKYELDINVFVSLNCLFSLLFLGEKDLRNAHSLFIRSNEKLAEINTFRVRKTTISSTFLIRISFQGHRCESGIAIFALRLQSL